MLSLRLTFPVYFGEPHFWKEIVAAYQEKYEPPKEGDELERRED
jgi:hypothetical protein